VKIRGAVKIAVVCRTRFGERPLKLAREPVESPAAIGGNV